MLPNGFYGGTVKFFDPLKQFGFITEKDSGREIFFHLNDGQFFEVKASESTEHPVFTGESSAKNQGKTRHLRDPREGDRLVFKKSVGQYGQKAAPWGYYGLWANCEQWLADHSLEIARYKEVVAKRDEDERLALADYPAYRVCMIQNSLGKPPMEEILWEGDDLEKFMHEFPAFRKPLSTF